MAKALEGDDFEVATASIAAARHVGRTAVRRAGHLASAISHHHHRGAGGASHSSLNPRAHAGGGSDRMLLATPGADSSSSSSGSSGGGKSGGGVKAKTSALPKPINNMVKNYISSAFFKVG